MKNPTPVLLCAAWLQISKQPNYRDLWLCDETIPRRIRSLQPALNANCTAINRALIGVSGSHQELNIFGLFHVVFKSLCLYSQTIRDVHNYYRYVRVEPSFPRLPSDVEDIFAKSFRLVEERAISARDSSKK